MKKRIRTYKFWVAISASLMIVIQAVCKIFNVEVSEDVYNDFINGLLGVFVVCGFIEKPTANTKDDSSQNSQDKNHEHE